MTWVLLLGLANGIVVVDLPDEATCRRILDAANAKGLVVNLQDGSKYEVPKGGGLGCVLRSDYEHQSKPKAGA